VAVQESGSAIYVADSGADAKFNSRQSSPRGAEVADGGAQAGLHIELPGRSGGASSPIPGHRGRQRWLIEKQFVGGGAAILFRKFDADGNTPASIDGSNTPSGHFVDLRAWPSTRTATSDRRRRQCSSSTPRATRAKWANPFGSARERRVDSDGNAVYLTDGVARPTASRLGADDDGRWHQRPALA
jgi:hypothetical protein